MKKIIKLFLCSICSLLLVFSTVGCADTTQTVIDSANRPDYSKNTEVAKIWAYEATVNDWYQIGGERFYFEEGMITSDETMQLYVDGNFNTLFVNYNFQYNSLHVDFETSNMKVVMDLAEKYNLPCFIFHNGIHGLSGQNTSLINKAKALEEINRELPDREYFMDENDFKVSNALSEGYNLTANDKAKINEEKAIEELVKARIGRNKFYSEKDLDGYIELQLEDVKDHPMFRGISLKDEPTWDIIPQVGEVYRSIVRVLENDGVETNDDIYVMMNMLPFNVAGYHKTYFAENGASMTSDEAYMSYLNTFYEHIGQYSGYFQYDDYPIINDGIWESYLHAYQMTAEFCAEKGLEQRMVMQSTKYSNRRATTEGDMYFQASLAQAFGNKDFSYYTYNPSTNVSNSEAPDPTVTIVDRLGKPNPRYEWVKKVNSEILFNSKALLNFEYKGMTYKTKAPMPGGMGYVNNITDDQMTLLKDYSFTVNLQSGGMVLITELYDAKNDQYGYYVVNAGDPAYAHELVVTLDFGDMKYAQIYQMNTVNDVKTTEGKITVNLGTGRGAFVMPFTD